MNYTGASTAASHSDRVVAASRNYVGLVRHATMAASSHNTQPWKFALQPNRIVMLPDFSRRCPEVDPDDHHLFCSLGCAAENLVLAAGAVGLRGHLSYRASESSLQVDFEAATPTTSSLVHAIPLRQCSRTEYDGTALTVEQLRLLERAGRGDGVSVMILAGNRHKEQLAEYVAAGNAAQFEDPRWADEMRKWIRFNRREAVRTGDGLYGAVLGIPSVPRWLGKLLMRVAVSAERQSEKDLRHIRSSAAIAVLFSETDDIPHWIEAGRCYERLALQASALDLRTAFINQPVEVAALRPQLAGFLGIGHRRPDLVVRIGRGPAMPRSFRRPVEQVLVAT